jgi:hypothetical protein
MTIKRKIVVALAVAFVAIVSWPVGYIAWREYARSTFAGCNLANREMARVECLSAKMELDRAKTDGNMSPAELQILSQHVAMAEADVIKWEAHVWKYGHLEGTGTSGAR